MNIKTRGMMLVAAFGLLCGNAGATHLQPSPETIKVENSDQWVMIQNENGIQVYFTKYKLEEEYFLKIKFENTTNQPINFIWRLSKNNEFVIITEDSMAEIYTELAPSETKTFGENVFININKSASYKDFSITTTLK